MADGNPYVNAASDMASGAMHAAGALRSAAAQQAALQEQQRKAAMSEQMDMSRLLNQGWQEYSPSENVGSTSSGLKTRDYKPAPSNLVTFPTIGKQLYRPPIEEQKAKQAQQQQTYSDLQSALKAGGEPLNPRGDVWEQTTTPRLSMSPQGTVSDTGQTGVHVAPPDQSRVLAVPGGPLVYMPTDAQQAQAGLQQKLAETSAMQDATSTVLPDSLAAALEQKSGLPPGSLKGVKLPKEAASTVYTHLTAPAQTPKYTTGTQTDKTGKVTVTRTAEGGSPEMWNGQAWVPLPADNQLGKPQEPPGQRSASSQQDIEDTAQGIFEGRISPVLSQQYYRDRTAIQGNLMRRDPKYNLALAEQDWKAIQRHLASLNGVQQERLRQAITFTYDSLDVIDNLYNEWQKYGRPSGLKVFNKISLAAAKNLPGKTGATATALEAQINDLISELGTVYKGGNASTDDTLRLAAASLKGEWNEETFKKQMGLIRTNLRIRKNSIMTSQAVGVTPGSPYTPQGETGQGTGGGAQAPGRGPAVGAIEQGYRFKGGDPSKPESWEKVR